MDSDNYYIVVVVVDNYRVLDYNLGIENIVVTVDSYMDFVLDMDYDRLVDMDFEVDNYK
jgi:hypothetical protein